MAEPTTVRQVIQGFDVATFVTPAAAADGAPILTGRYQRLEATFTHDVEEYLETEEQIAEILDGQFTIEGMLSRGWQNLDLASKFLVDGSGVPLTQIDRSTRIYTPKFTITFKVNSPGKPQMHGATVTLKDCKFLSMNWAIAAGKGVVPWDMRFRGMGFGTPTGV